MKKHSYLIPFMTLFVMACSNQPDASQADQQDTLSASSAPTELTEPLSDFDLVSFTFPARIVNDSIDVYFDETINGPLTAAQTEKLQLNKLEPTEGVNWHALGQFHFSDQFKTRLILRNAAWSEWKMWLVTYDAQNNMLDQLLVLYGDNVEYYSETFSTVTAEKIEVNEVIYDYSTDEEKSTSTVKNYRLDESGHFQNY